MTMPDGNTAALRQHMVEQDKAESVYEAYSKRVIEDLVDDVINGKGIKRGKNKYLTAVDFVDDNDGLECFTTSYDVMTLLLGDEETRFDVKARLVKKLEGMVKDWLETKQGQELIQERCWELEQDKDES